MEELDMKLMRFGPKGDEKPAIVDADGGLRVRSEERRVGEWGRD